MILRLLKEHKSAHISVFSRMTVFYIGQLKAKEIKIYYRMTCVN